MRTGTSFHIIVLVLLSMLALDAQDLEISGIEFPLSHTPSTIGAMTQDHVGNIWMVDINQGLIKYDGEEFERIVHERDNPNALVSNRLECIMTDGDGMLWIGSFANGLQRFDPVNEVFTTFQHDQHNPQSIRSNSIRSLVEDQDGGLWIGTASGLDYYDRRTGRFRNIIAMDTIGEILAHEQVRTLFVDRAGIIWAGTSSPFFGEESLGGLFRIDKQTGKVRRYVHSSDPRSLISDVVTAIFEDSQGRFWVGTDGDGLHTMDRASGTFTRHSYDPSQPRKLSRPPLNNASFVNDHIRFIREDRQGQIWIGTVGNGLNRYDPENEQVQYFGENAESDYRIPHKFFWNCLVTGEGLIWFSSWSPTGVNNILFRVNLDPNQVYTRDLGIGIGSFAEGDHGQIYLGSENRLFELDTNGHLSVLLDMETTEPVYFRDLYLNHNTLWISSNQGLLQYDLAKDELTTDPGHGLASLGLTTKQIHVTTFVNADTLLVGTNDGLFYYDIQGKRFTKLNHSEAELAGAASKRIEDLEVDQQGRIWVGYRSYGLKRLDTGSGDLIDYTFIPGIQERVYDLYEDEHQTLYIANWRAGLRKYDPIEDQFIPIVDRSGYLNDESMVYGVIGSDDSTLWLNMRDGIVKYDIPSQTSFVYGSAWGISGVTIITDEFFRSSVGDYYVGTRNGFIRFKPGDFERSSDYVSKPQITHLTINDGPAMNGDTLEGLLSLSYRENDLSFQIGFVDFLNTSEGKELEYRLEPHDPKWRKGSNGQEVFYYNLFPGDYRFMVKARDLYGARHETMIPFTIHAPWYSSWWAWILYVLALGSMLRLFLVYRAKKLMELNRRLEEKVESRTKELEFAKAEAEGTLASLRSTQAQLIHSEKMASLGELTAGIAHEIQNPLNFVNNFSEVNREMIDELSDALSRGDQKEVAAIMQDLRANESKVIQHGKRAEGIIKSMLQHSRTSEGTKAPTDLNVLCEEYVRLAYHGMRARDKSFKAEFELDLDPDLPMANVIPQDIGRVILNLVNNAFQAVANVRDGKVVLQTESTDGSVKVSVKDNGPGISDEIKDKIFQPFFTTKPAGQGTGLGLSLSYDIVTKGHGGSLELFGEKGEGATFIMTLPL